LKVLKFVAGLLWNTFAIIKHGRIRKGRAASRQISNEHATPTIHNIVQYTMDGQIEDRYVSLTEGFVQSIEQFVQSNI